MSSSEDKTETPETEDLESMHMRPTFVDPQKHSPGQVTDAMNIEYNVKPPPQQQQKKDPDSTGKDQMQFPSFNQS